MAVEIGARVGVNGAAAFQQDLRRITQQGKELAAEMKAVAASFDQTTASQTKLSATAATLTKQIENQKQRVSLLDTVYQESKSKLEALLTALTDSKNEYGENSKEVERAVSAYNRQSVAVSKAKTDLNNATAVLNKMENQLADVNDQMEDNINAHKSLSDRIEDQKKKIDKIVSALDEAVDAYGDSSEEAEKWRKELERAAQKLDALEAETKGSADATDDLGESMSKASKEAASFGDVLKANLLSQAIVKSIKALASVITNNLDAAFARVDTIKSYSLVMTGLGYMAEETEKSISDLTEGIQGLPTALPDIVSVQQQFAALYGDLEDATAVTIALNNATLAGGQGQEKANSALEQWYQIIANGTPDAQSWKIILQAMPAQLKQIAQELLGVEASSQDLYTAWKDDGIVTTEDVTNAIVKLSKEGGEGFDSFAAQAQSASGGIQTSLTNIKTAIVSKLASVVQEIEGDGGRISGTLAEIKAQIQGIDVQPIVDTAGALFDMVTEHGAEVLSVVAGIGAAFVTWNVASMIAKVTAAIQAMEGATVLAKIAQLALNSAFAANPIGAVITVVAGLTAAVVTLWNTNENFRNFFINAWESIKTTVTTTLATATAAFDTFRYGVIQKARDVGNGIIEGIGSAIDWLKGLASQAGEWASDMMDGFIAGIMRKIGAITDAVGSIGNAIRSMLHFSRPDKGPLRDYEKWMPDMIRGMAKGIRTNAYQLENASDYLASRMAIPQIDAQASVASPAPAGSTATYGGINITVYGAQGQNVDELVDVMMQKMQYAVSRREALWA